MTIIWPGPEDTEIWTTADGKEVEEPAYPTLAVNYSLDGCGSLSDAALRLRKMADEYEEAERVGWRLAEPIDQGLGDLVPADDRAVRWTEEGMAGQ